MSKHGDQIGNLTVILGCMFARKSNSLLTMIERHELAGKKCIVVDHATNTRYQKQEQEYKLVTHNQLSKQALQCLCISEILDVLKTYDVIGIDEIQFFPTKTVELIEYLVNVQNKIVFVAGLSSDKDREPFGNTVTQLIAKAENIVHVKAVCLSCGKDASFTKKIPSVTTSDHDVSNKQIEIGSADMYVACCRKCYYTKT